MSGTLLFRNKPAPAWLLGSPAESQVVPIGKVFEKTKTVPGSGLADAYKRLSLTMQGVLPRSRDADDGLQPTNFDGYQLLRPGQLVFKLIDLENVSTSRVGLSDLEGLVSPAYMVLIPRPVVNPRYALWFFLDLYNRRVYNNLGEDGVRSSLGWDTLKNLPFVLPPLATQERIVRFLDVETAKIDKLIAKQQELLSMLDHRDVGAREALFASAVGDGKRLKHYLSEKDIRLGAVPLESNPLLSVSIHWGVQPRQEAVGSESTADRFEHYKMVAPGDIVLNRMRAFQGAVGCSLVRGITSPDYAVLVSSPDVRPEWLVQVIKTQRFLDEIVVRLKGIGGTESGKVRTPRINMEDLLEIAVDVPEISQQLVAMEELNAQSEKTARLRRLANTHIQLLSERRSALVTAAVTGQIEV